MIVDIFLKIAQNVPLSQSEMEELSAYISASHTTTAKITNMREISELGYDLGEVWAGRFIASADPNNNDVSSSTFRGTYMDANGVTGKNAGTTQFQLSSTDGKATAGGGQVVLDENGVSVLVSDAFYDENSYKFVDGSGNTVSYLNCYGDPTYKMVSVQAKPVTGQSSGVFVKSDCPTSKTSSIELFADYNSAGTTPARIYLYNNGTPTVEITANTITFSGNPAGKIVSGTYTPTLTNSTNISSSTAAETHYARVGNVVTVGGRFTATATAAGTCAMGMSLPIASNFAATENLGGTAVGSQIWTAYARADSTNDRAVFVWSATNTTATDFFFTISYRII